MPTSHNSPIYEGLRQGRDAACVAVARGEGAVILGKTIPWNSPPPAVAPSPATRTTRRGRRAAPPPARAPPWRTACCRWPSARRPVAALIRPASFNGVYGMKPTHGVVNSEGASAIPTRSDTIGWYGRAPPGPAPGGGSLPAVRPRSCRSASRCGSFASGFCRGPNWHLAARGIAGRPAAGRPAAGSRRRGGRGSWNCPPPSRTSPRRSASSCSARAAAPSCGEYRRGACPAASRISAIGWRTAPASPRLPRSPPTTWPASAASCSMRCSPASTRC